MRMGLRAKTPTPPGTASHSDLATPCVIRNGWGGPQDGVKPLSPAPSSAAANFLHADHLLPSSLRAYAATIREGDQPPPLEDGSDDGDWGSLGGRLS